MIKIWNGVSPKKRDVMRVLLIFISIITQTIDFFWPKKKDVIICGSNLGISMGGSSKYFYEYIKQTQKPIRIFFYLPFQEETFWAQIKYMVSYFPLFFQAKVLITTHPPYDFFPYFGSRRKIIINVWHGIPIKGMFYSDFGVSESNLKIIRNLNKQTSFFPVASSIEAGLFTRCFLLDPRKIIFVGHMRNDHLVSCGHTDIVNKIIPNLPRYSTLILYCPTYRRNASIRFFPFDDFNNSHLNHFLEEHQIVILTRSHIKDNRIQSAFQSNRIFEIGQDLLPEINDILPEIDILITDYSGIFFDYLLCNRPCIFIPYDRDEYERDVGLLFDDYDYWTPGTKVYTYREFIGAIEEILSGHDIFKAKREEMRDIFHYYQKGNTCEKILHLINELYCGEKE